MCPKDAEGMGNRRNSLIRVGTLSSVQVLRIFTIQKKSNVDAAEMY